MIDQNDELIAVITTVPISQPYTLTNKSEETENCKYLIYINIINIQYVSVYV